MKTVLKTSMLPLMAFLLLVAVIRFTSADPSGANIQFNSTGTSSTSLAGNLTNPGGSINFVNLAATQQDAAWKAYVGNVSGLLTLDDFNGKTIYNWALASVQGRVFASRFNNITWSSINCSVQANVDAEQTAVSFASSDSDSINRTFIHTNHTTFLVAARNMTGCKFTPTFVNDSAQPVGPSSFFQETLLSDGTDMVYATIVESASPEGFDSGKRHFQLIVPQSKVTQTPTLYYFYVELG